MRVSIRDKSSSPTAIDTPAPAPASASPREPSSIKPALPPPRTAVANVERAEPSKGEMDPVALLAMKRRRPPAADAAAAPAGAFARYSHLGLGKVTHVNDRPYRVLSARAVRAENYSSALGPVLFEENGLRVVEDRSPGWNTLIVGDGTQPLMVNPANGRLVVVTGTLKVSITDAASASRLASDEHLQLLQFDPAIKLAFLKAPAGYALLPALSRIGQRAGVTQVELEAIEGRAVPR